MFSSLSIVFFYICHPEEFFFVVFNVPRALCPVQHDYELLFLDLFLLVWDGWWRQHISAYRLGPKPRLMFVVDSDVCILTLQLL